MSKIDAEMLVTNQTALVLRRVTQARRLLIVLLVLASSLLITLLSTIVLLYRDVHPSNQFLSAAQHPFTVGQTISLGSVTVAVDTVTYSDGQQPFTAPADKHYAILTLTVRNNGDKPIQVLPASDTYVKDQLGKVAYLTPFSLTDPFRAGELLPGEQISGQLSYLIAKSGPSKFFVDAIWSGGVLPFALN